MLEENVKIIRRYGTRPVDDEMQEFRRNLPAWGSRIRDDVCCLFLLPPHFQWQIRTQKKYTLTQQV